MGWGVERRVHTHTHTHTVDFCCCVAETNMTLSSSYPSMKNLKNERLWAISASEKLQLLVCMSHLVVLTPSGRYCLVVVSRSRSLESKAL